MYFATKRTAQVIALIMRKDTLRALAPTLATAVHSNRRFVFMEWPEPLALIASKLNATGATGIIAEYDAELLDWIPGLTQKTVLILADVLTDGCACVAIDDWSVGTSAANYLHRKELREFAYFGSDSLSSILRGAAFKEQISKMGNRVQEFKLSTQLPFQTKTQRAALERWIDNLPRPVGIFTESAQLAVAVSEVCLHNGIAIPNEVALLSATDDPVMELSFPGISCIQLPWAEIARVSLAQLEAPQNFAQSNPILIPPTGIRTRASTDFFHTRHESLQKVIRYMQSNFMHPINIEVVARACGFNRRSIERLFQTELNTSPKAVLTQMRTHQASDLLRHTTKTVAEIAQLSGFPSSAALCSACIQQFGQTPRALRTKPPPPRAHRATVPDKKASISHLK
jgi:LacI family transcriptional regulator